MAVDLSFPIYRHQYLVPHETQSCPYYGTFMRWQLRNRSERKQQSLLFDLFKAFDQIERFISEKTYFLHACATCFKLPSNISTVVHTFFLIRALIQFFSIQVMQAFPFFKGLRIFFDTSKEPTLASKNMYIFGFYIII